MSTAQDKFVADIEKFLTRYKMSASAFGTEFASSPKFVFDLRKGRSVRLDTAEKIREKMKAYRKR